MLDLLLIFTLGFLGSFGHCVGMCGPITVAFSLSHKQDETPPWWQQLVFHGLLNGGRILSYALIGLAIGGLGSVLIAGGQMAGVGSVLRRGIALFTGSLLIWVGIHQINPGFLPKIPFLHPLLQGKLHHQLSSTMVSWSLRSHWWTPALLGAAWGLIPCGFLYAAQIKAAETGDMWQGGLTMLAFGLGTLPTMLGVGVSTAFLSADRRSQLFRLGGWITLIIGLLTLLRTGNTMPDYAGHGALICLMLALVARPLQSYWPALLRYRRALGVGAFVLSVAHTVHMVEHAWHWNLKAIQFMIPRHQWSLLAGAIAFTILAALALTSSNWAQQTLGKFWRRLHLLAVPALLLVTVHMIGLGSHYLGGFQITWVNQSLTALLVGVISIILILRWRMAS